MGKYIVTFGNIKIEKNDFYNHKTIWGGGGGGGGERFRY